MATETIKCPHCGGPLEFKPEIQKNKCDYCQSEFTQEELLTIYGPTLEYKEVDQEQELTDKSKKPVQDEDLQEYHCDSCGAQVVTEKTTSTTFCYYCHNPVILKDRLEGDFRPDAIIPFKMSKDLAIEKFLAWAKSYRYVPKDFYSQSHLEKMTGLYFPNWLTQVELDTNYQGKGTTVRVWVSGDRQYTQRKTYQLARQGHIKINNLTEIALAKIDHDLLKSVNPYNYDEKEGFDVNFLNGFFSEKYDLGKNDLEDRMIQGAKEQGDKVVRSTMRDYDSVKLDESRIEAAIKGWEYTLLPVWIMTYQYQGKMYIYAVNGQTGKAFGQLPLDKHKLIRSSLLLAIFILFLFLLGGYLI